MGARWNSSERLPLRPALLAVAALLCAAGIAFSYDADAATRGSARSPAAHRAAEEASLTLAPVAAGAGEAGRHELGGSWLFRFDGGRGLQQHFQNSTSSSGWTHVAVPSAWNAHDQSKASMAGTVAWYRRDFRLPSDAGTPESYSWIAEFQSVNNRVQAWLNGQPIGRHTGAYLPFSLALPAHLLNAGGVNHLVLRVDSRRRATDFPGVALWWNYGGILRKPYLRRVAAVAFASVQVLPSLPCRSCEATVSYSVSLRSYSSIPQLVHLTSAYGEQQVDLGSATIPAGSSATFVGRAAVVTPQLWSPASPYLYPVTLDAEAVPQGAPGAPTSMSRYTLRSGIRSIAVSPAGTLLLNGQKLDFRGVGLIEDSPTSGGALSEAADRRLVNQASELGATLIRSQYPLSQHLEELADEKGIALWSEIPVDQLAPRYLAERAVRSRAVATLRQNILANSSHAAIVIWSIADELAPRPDAAQGAYIAAAVAAAHTLDPTRPVGLAVAAYPSVGCQSRYYAPLDVIGLNDYFGWYPGPVGDLRNRNALPGYLDAMHSCYHGKALVVSEFGAEANRAGPQSERGSYAFQEDFVRFHLGVFDERPWLSGAVCWALEDFRVRPGWTGGNPKPSPPLHTKGLVDFSGARKPAYYAVQQSFLETLQADASAP